MTIHLSLQECELLAKTVHERYLDDRRTAGDLVPDKPTHQPWSDLLPETRAQNFEQVNRHIASLGQEGLLVVRRSELATGANVITEIEGERLDSMARREHDGWVMKEALSGNRQHGNIVHWDDLSASEKKKDYSPVRGLPSLFDSVDIVVIDPF